MKTSLLPKCLLMAGLVACGSLSVHAQGPGLGQPTFTQGELFQPFVVLGNAQGLPIPRPNQELGICQVSFYKGWLIAPVAINAAGQNDENGLSVWDLSNPRSPRLAKHLRASDNTLFRDVREAHGFSLTHNGILAIQARLGVMFWDVSDPQTPRFLSYMQIPGLTQLGVQSYLGSVWWVHGQHPYYYAGGLDRGIHIIKASDPTAPQYIKTIDKSNFGNIPVGPVHAFGNFMAITHGGLNDGDPGPNAAFFDISDPENPRLIKTLDPGSVDHYASMLYGDFVYHAHWGGSVFYDITDLQNPFVRTERVPRSQQINPNNHFSLIQYGTFQDEFLHLPLFNTYAKLRLSDFGTVGITPLLVSSVGDANKFYEFTTPLGNMVLASGGGGGHGARLVPHQTNPDRTAPRVNRVNPPNNAVNQARSSRIAVCFTDHIDVGTVGTGSFIVRPLGGSALAGTYSHQFGIVNFSPAQPLAANTTYEIVVTSGVKDFAGNGATSFTSRFATGAQIGGQDPAPLTVAIDATTPATSGSAVTFRATASGGSGGLRYAWTFGDGTAETALGSASSASHTFASPGNYRVQVRVVDSSNNTRSATIGQVIHDTIASGTPRQSSQILVHSSRREVWNVNPDNNTVSVINPDSLAKIREVAVGQHPLSLTEASDGRIWVANRESDSVSVIVPSTGAVAATVPLGHGARPAGIVGSASGAVYVALEGEGRVLRLNASGEATGSVDVGPMARALALSADGSRLLVSRLISSSANGEIWEIATSSFTKVRTFALGLDPGPDTLQSGRGLPNYLTGVAISPDNRRALFAAKKDNIQRGLARDGERLNSENTVRTIVGQLNLVNNTDQVALRADLNDSDSASALTLTPLGNLALVAVQGSGRLIVVDAYGNGTVGTSPFLGVAPQGVAFDPTTRRAFVHVFLERSVAALDVGRVLTLEDTNPTVVGTVKVVANETLSSTVLQGKRVFYNAADSRMTDNGYISCATCHLDGDSDGQTWDFTDRGEGLRNTITLRGRGGMNHGFVHWSANFDEIQDFEHDIRNAFGGRGFLTDAQFNTGTRNTPLGDKKANVSTDLDALAAYVASLRTFERSPFRNADGTLTADAVAGQALFAQLNCATCHSGPQLTDSAGRTTPLLHDVGTLKPSSGKRLGQTLTGLDTPSLLGIWNTAPYLHDGSAATLNDVLVAANPSGRHGNLSGLSASQIGQLVSYLRQLDGSDAYRINFQPATAPTPSGYLADSGESFGSRNGLSYGWSAAITGDTRERNSDPDKRLDTLIHLQKSGNRSWELAVPNGTYHVTLACGDAIATDQINHLDVEGVSVRDEDGGDRFDEFQVTVQVTDGRLTISPGSGASNAKLCYVEVLASAAAGSGTTGGATGGSSTGGSTGSGSTGGASTGGSTGGGSGLSASYFSGTALAGTPVLTRTDATVDFSWSGSPGTGVSADNFSVRWSGEIEPPVTGTYTVQTESDDGIRVWINGTQVINNWTDHGSTLDTSGPLAWTAGQKVSVTVEYYERGGGAVARLRWIRPGQTGAETIPQAALLPGSGSSTSGGTTGGTPSFSAQVNFQPAGTAVPAGYVRDSGDAYGTRNGLSYGWSANVASGARERFAESDKRLDTLLHLQQGGNHSWEIGVPNGSYRVTIVCGDASYMDQINSLQVEGIALPDPDGADRFDTFTTTVTVSDGRLTVAPGSGASNAKICYIEVSSN